MRFTFLHFLTEKYALDDCEYLVQAKTIDADPHEILTAFLCLDTYYNKYLTNLQSQSGNKLLGTINNIITDICTAIDDEKIIGVKSDELTLFTNLSTKLTNLKNTNSSTKESKKITKNNTKLKNSKKSDNAEEDNQNDKDKIDTLYKNIIAALQDNKKIFTLYKNIITALPQAASAAIAINSNFKSNFTKSISTVYLTGASWPADVKKFTISKHGMDGYNSSDIIVTDGSTDGSQYLGVSLKKKDDETKPDPTIINKSLFKLEVDGTQLKDIPGQDEVKFKDMFDTWFAEQIDADFTKKGFIFDKKWVEDNPPNPSNALSYLFNENTLSKVKNTKMLSNFYNKKLTDAGKKHFRNLINNNLKLTGTGSIFDSLKEFFNKNKKITDNLANQLVDLVFKPDLIKLLDAKNPELESKFDFAVCTGIGKTIESKKSKNNPISFTISKAKYLPIATISNVLTNLGFENPKKPAAATLVIVDKPSNAAKIFMKLQIGEIEPIVVANLEIRYKGTYSPSPQFLGTISDEFKEKIKEMEKPKKSKKLKKK